MSTLIFMFFSILLTQYTCTDCVLRKVQISRKGTIHGQSGKKYTPKVHFLVGGRRDMARPRLEIQELSSLKCHSLILTPILHKSAVVIFRQQLKTFDSNNFTLSSVFSFQNVWPIKTKAVYTLVLSIYSFISS